MSRWSSGHLPGYEPRGSGSIPEARNLEICILRFPSLYLILRYVFSGFLRRHLPVGVKSKKRRLPAQPAAICGDVQGTRNTLEHDVYRAAMVNFFRSPVDFS